MEKQKDDGAAETEDEHQQVKSARSEAAMGQQHPLEEEAVGGTSGNRGHCSENIGARAAYRKAVPQHVAKFVVARCPLYTRT